MKTRKEEWYTDPSKQQRLGVLLDDPIMKEAMAVIEEENLPKDDGVPLPSAETLTFAAMNFKKLSGLFDYRRQLKDLCSSIPAGPQGAPRAYSDEHVETWAKSHGIPLPDKTVQPN